MHTVCSHITQSHIRFSQANAVPNLLPAGTPTWKVSAMRAEARQQSRSGTMAGARMLAHLRNKGEGMDGERDDLGRTRRR